MAAAESTAEKPGTRTALPLWKKVLFSTVLLLVVLVSLEVAAQIYVRATRGYSGGSFLQFQFDPYKNILPVPNLVDTRGVRHNAQGFRRSQDVSKEKSAGTFRIFLMGASAAYGTGGLWPHLQRDYQVLDNSETIDAYLEEILNEALPYDRVEVINAAIPSVQTHHHLIYLNQTILGFEPDLILFLDGLNDHFYHRRSHDQFADYAYNEASHVIMGPPTVQALVRMNLWWLSRRSAFAHVAIGAAQRLKRVILGPPQVQPVQVEQALVDLRWVFERNALKMIERSALILQHEGIPALFMLQPMLILERERLGRMVPIERTLFEFNVQQHEPNNEEYVRRAVRILASMIEQTVKPLGAEFLDLTRIYRDVEGVQVFTDYAHLTPEANRMLAERVAEKILSMLGSAQPGEVPEAGTATTSSGH